MRCVVVDLVGVASLAIIALGELLVLLRVSLGESTLGAARLVGRLLM